MEKTRPLGNMNDLTCTVQAEAEVSEVFKPRVLEADGVRDKFDTHTHKIKGF